MPTEASEDVFAHLEAATPQCSDVYTKDQNPKGHPVVELAGPWSFYQRFREAHCLDKRMPVANPLEIGVKSGTTLGVPLRVLHDAGMTLDVSISVKAPEGWKASSGTGKFQLPAEGTTALRLELETPLRTESELRKAEPQEVTITVRDDSGEIGIVRLRVALQSSALPQ